MKRRDPAPSFLPLHFDHELHSAPALWIYDAWSTPSLLQTCNLLCRAVIRSWRRAKRAFNLTARHYRFASSDGFAAEPSVQRAPRWGADSECNLGRLGPSGYSGLTRPGSAGFTARVPRLTAGREPTDCLKVGRTDEEGEHY